MEGSNCTPLGLHPPYFFPEKPGKDYPATPYLDVLKDFRDDPVKNALPTPSGKIEIFSSNLYAMSLDWPMEPGNVITPVQPLGCERTDDDDGQGQHQRREEPGGRIEEQVLQP